MNKTFYIAKKINLDSETDFKKKQVNDVCEYIDFKMSKMGFKAASIDDAKVDYVFAVGGDGTMMHAMNQFIEKESLIIGVNAGNVGFLTPYNISNVFDGSLLSFLDKEHRIEKRSILNYKYDKHKIAAVNEYAFTAKHPNNVISYFIEIEKNGHCSKAGHYKANTLLVSGPVGSTAYNMNAGGAIIDPSMKAMQIVMIAPTTLGTRPLIISPDAKIHIIFNDNIQIFSDGILTDNVKPGERITLTLTDKETSLLVPDEWNFFSVLSKKLHWNNGMDV